MGLLLTSSPLGLCRAAQAQAAASTKPPGRLKQRGVECTAKPTADHQCELHSLSRRSLAFGLVGLAAASPSSSCLAASRKGKRTGLPITELMAITAEDVGQRKSLVTGQVDKSVYDDQLDFGDPSVKQIGLDKYIKGVSTLFDPTSQVDLISVDQVDDSTFKTRWRLAAKVNFPFKLTLKPYLGNTIYKINQDHLIQSQTDEWDISALDIFVSAFFPSFGAPAAPPV